MAGCFGLSAVSAAPPVCRVRYYTHDVTACRRELRQRLQTVMGDIYRLMVAALLQHQEDGGEILPAGGGGGLDLGNRGRGGGARTRKGAGVGLG